MKTPLDEQLNNIIEPDSGYVKRKSTKYRIFQELATFIYFISLFFAV